VTTGALYGWGFAGGLCAAMHVFVLPEVARAALIGRTWVTRDRALAMGALVVFLAMAAGLVPLIPEHVTRGQAIGLGLASQPIVRGLVTSARDALPGYSVLPRGPTTAT
jgi:hypothetical protein